MKASTRFLELVHRGTVLLSLAIILPGAASPQTCTPIPSGLVDWWPGDGNAKDIVGGNNGTPVGGVTFAPGEVGQAFSFDGLTGAVVVPDAPSLDQTATDKWMPGSIPQPFQGLTT